ncbi:FtsK/SpoIIIE domain-containing protein [Listeria fleischmannii]|uniref:Cell division FtsK/SpoIIIE family protein n=1 Tax=Listeria fleischmannii FSL S10-1203 TaxID=1265822 RepID=W7DGW7_9LIST|nr:FtsK/SpoIIIE domain-containing protein [Listeria fleischmannii]EUJ48685.1 cell division FtsK/SpoIIIE family protein [Listeria fleischmannii FSL S10-1203]
MEKGYMGYRFVDNIIADRITIEELVSEEGRLSLMKRVIWDFDKLPHMLVTGGTGAGKSYFILAVLKGLLNGTCKEEDVYICDPKNSDLADLEAIFTHVKSKKDGIAMLVRQFKEAMMERTDSMKTLGNYEMGSNYRSLGLQPQFLIFDEFVAYMETLSDFKERENVLSNIKQIVMLGRQVGYFLVLGMQRPDAKYLADGIRDQFHFRVALGKNSSMGYSMMFGEVDKKFTYKPKKGFGYVDAGKGVISEFYSPFISKGFDFMEEFKKIS